MTSPPSCFYFYTFMKGKMNCCLAFSIFVDMIIAYTLLNFAHILFAIQCKLKGRKV